MDLSRQVAHWRGLVERYGGSTTEIVDIEFRQEEEDTTKIVNRSLEEQLKRNEALNEGKFGIFTSFIFHIVDISSFITQN